MKKVLLRYGVVFFVSFFLRILQAMRICYRFSTGVTVAGQKFDTFVGLLIMLNVAAVMAESEPSLGNRPGPSGARIQAIFDIFEVGLEVT